MRYRTLEFPGLCLTRHISDDQESSYGKGIPDENDPYSSGGGLGLYIKSDWNFHFRDDLRIDTIENVHLSQTIHTSNIERLATFIWSPHQYNRGENGASFSPHTLVSLFPLISSFFVGPPRLNRQVFSHHSLDFSFSGLPEDVPVGKETSQ